MHAERARLKRLKRLEHLRSIARQAAALDAAKAESALAQLEALAGRTRALARDYAARGGVGTGGELQHLGRFTECLSGIAAGTASDAVQARGHADSRLAELALAERRRAAIGEHVENQARALARRALGTGLE